MRLWVKIALLVGCATTLPLVMVLLVVVPDGTRALRGQLGLLYAQDARALVAQCERSVLDDLDRVSSATRSLRLGELQPDAREQALLLLYRDTRRAGVVGLFDKQGNAVSPSVRFEALDGAAAQEHELVGELALAAYSHHVPLEAALETGLAIGPVYSIPDPEGLPVPRVVLAARVPGRDWIVAVELSLRNLVKTVREVKIGSSGRAILVDSRGRVIAHPDLALVRERADLSSDALFAGAESRDRLGAVATAPILGWRVLVEQSADEGLASVRKLALHAALWVALSGALALAGALYLTRRVLRPVQQLRSAARSVRAGELEARVPVESRDELGELAIDFNGMVDGLRERDEMKLFVSLSSTLDLHETLQRLLDAVGRRLPYERATVLIARSGAFEVALTRGVVDAAEAALLVPRDGGETPTDRAVRLRMPELSTSGELLALPLLSREDEVAGLLCLERKSGFEAEQARTAFAWLRPATLALDHARLFEEVKRLATVDGLTGIANRRHFLLVGERLFDSARRYGQPLSVMMLDVDHFKTVNDRYGHAVGDAVLRTTAERIRGCLRGADLVGRYGGEEFAVVLPMTEGGTLATLGERIRRAVSGEAVNTSAGPISVTVSIGLATAAPETVSLDELLGHADANLYRAKEAGRDRVVA